MNSDTPGGLTRRTRSSLSASGADVPLVLELVAIALRAGQPLPGALHAVGEALPGQEGGELVRLAEALDLGMPRAIAFAAAPPRWEPLRMVAGLAERTGADLAGLLMTQADETRRERRRAAEVEAASLGVRLVLPTGLCILPAFILLGIVPTVMSLLEGVQW